MHFNPSLAVTPEHFLPFSLFTNPNCSSGVGLALGGQSSFYCPCSPVAPKAVPAARILEEAQFIEPQFLKPINIHTGKSLCTWKLRPCTQLRKIFLKISLTSAGIPVLQSFLEFNVDTWRFICLKTHFRGKNMNSHI